MRFPPSRWRFLRTQGELTSPSGKGLDPLRSATWWFRPRWRKALPTPNEAIHERVKPSGRVYARMKLAAISVSRQTNTDADDRPQLTPLAKHQSISVQMANRGSGTPISMGIGKTDVAVVRRLRHP